ncbi:MAG: tRNA 2-thiouridine(34) synthase MnmA [Burkholderiales bacterium]|nr:tRNA 2-thiouridine(34) synthase MnmA [Burkholderiales bacterium]
MSKGKVVVGLSGGVDSAVAAYLLKKEGYEVTGIFMKNWEDDDDDEYCSSRQDFIDAAAVADVLGINFDAVNFSKEYKDRVFSVFLKEYKAGRTPNPDVLCNSEIKFKEFLNHAANEGASRIATGHYARVRENNGLFELLKGKDPTKDQSYFLHRLNQHQLSKTIFPLGDMLKTDVRKIAKEIGLPNAEKKDSTGICFIGERPFREFLKRYVTDIPGPIKTPNGEVIGEHIGLAYYTIGQRKGIGIGGKQDSSGEPWFVARKDIPNNTLYVVQGQAHPWLYTNGLVALDASWISGSPAPVGLEAAVKVRYRMADQKCLLTAADATSFTITSFDPLWAVTPGQSAVLYDGDVCLGGGVIDHPEEFPPL